MYTSYGYLDIRFYFSHDLPMSGQKPRLAQATSAFRRDLERAAANKHWDHLTIQ